MVVCACVRACVHACMRACMRVCVVKCDRFITCVCSLLLLPLRAERKQNCVLVFIVVLVCMSCVSVNSCFVNLRLSHYGTLFCIVYSVIQKSYDALTSVSMLKSRWISKASALQRKGRCKNLLVFFKHLYC